MCARGAHLAPGNSPGTLPFTNGLTLNDGAILDFQLGNVIAGDTYALAFNGSTLELTATVSAIPEPATCAAFLGLCALALAASRRRLASPTPPAKA